MNYPWRPTAARNIYADSAASTTSLPSDRQPNHFPIAVGTVASRISFLQKLADNPKIKSPPKTPSRFPQTRPTRRENSNKSPQRSTSPPQLRPPLNRRRENSRSSFGRRPTKIFGTPASRNSQPNEQPQTGTNHSFLGLQTPRSNHDEGHARAGYNGTPRTDGSIGAPPGGLRGMPRADTPLSPWAPVTGTHKTSNKNRDEKTAGHRVVVGRGIQRLEDTFVSIEPPLYRQISKQLIRAPSPYCQKKQTRQDQGSNSETSIRTTSTLRRQSVRDLFDKYGIERPPGLASSELVREDVNNPRRHRVCHLCMWIHEKDENTCWKCGHRLCKACDRLSPSFKGGQEARIDYDEVLSGNRPKPSNSGPRITTPRLLKRQIAKHSTVRPSTIPLQTVKKDVPNREKFNSTEPLLPFYPKKSPPLKSSNAGHEVNPVLHGLLNSCTGIYVPENPQKSQFKPEDAPKTHRVHPERGSFCQYITHDQRSTTQSPHTHDSRCESCQPIDRGNVLRRHSISCSMARSDDVLAMDGDYTGENGHNENIYRSRSHPDSLKTSQLSKRLFRLFNGSMNRVTQFSHGSDRRGIPRTSTRSYKLATGPMYRKTQSSHEIDQTDHPKAKQPLMNSYRRLNASTYQPVQPKYGSDQAENPQASDSFYPFFSEAIGQELQSRYGSDYVECHGYPRTGHWDCDRSPISSGILGDCQHCLDDCACSACQSTVHSVRCCTNEVHRPMIHHHHSLAKAPLDASYGSSTSQPSSERKPYILSHSQTYDRSTLHKYDPISEWLGSPDKPPPQKPETPQNTPANAVYRSKDSSSIAITKVRDPSLILQTPSIWSPSLKPIISKRTEPLMKKALNKASQDAGSKVRAQQNRASSNDGTKDQSEVDMRSSSQTSAHASSGYFASNPWREKEVIHFPRSYVYGKNRSKSSLQQVSRRSTDCETSDICGQSEWAEQRQKNSISNSRKDLKKQTQPEPIQKRIHQWEDRRYESRRGRGTISATASEMETPVSGGYFDARMRLCSGGSMQGVRGIGEIGGMGSIEEEEGEGDVIEDENERHDCVWRRKVADAGERRRDHKSRDERERGVEETGAVKGVTIVVHMDNGEDLVLRTNSGGKLSWEGLERLLRVEKRD